MEISVLYAVYYIFCNLFFFSRKNIKLISHINPDEKNKNSEVNQE